MPRRRRWAGVIALAATGALAFAAARGDGATVRRAESLDRAIHALARARAGQPEQFTIARREFRAALAPFHGERAAHVGLHLTDALEHARSLSLARVDAFTAAIATGDDAAAERIARDHGGAWSRDAQRLARGLARARARLAPDKE